MIYSYMQTTKSPQATSTHSRAKAGGQFGANGEWYEGGKFINTVPENSKNQAPKKRGSGKQEIEPCKWEVAPEGKMSLYRQLAGVERFDFTAMQFSLNPGLRSEYATPEAVAKRQSKIAAFNSGVRWA